MWMQGGWLKSGASVWAVRGEFGAREVLIPGNQGAAGALPGGVQRRCRGGVGEYRGEVGNGVLRAQERNGQTVSTQMLEDPVRKPANPLDVCRAPCHHWPASSFWLSRRAINAGGMR